MIMEGFVPLALVGLLLSIALIELIIFWFANRQQKRLKREYEEWERAENESRRRKEEQEEERIRKIKVKLMQSAWLQNVADHTLQVESPIKRIEIWKNKLLIETETFEYDSLSKYGQEEEMTAEETYLANKVLYEIICKRGCYQFRLRDQYTYCEIVDLYEGLKAGSEGTIRYSNRYK